MKTPMLLTLLILILTVLVHRDSAFPSDRRAQASQERGASWDDVNVVAHGLLQLGQGLKEHVDKTKGQMRDIYAKLKVLDGAVAEAQRAPIVPREEATGTPTDAAGLTAQVEELRRENQGISSRMDRLEEKMNSSSDQPGVLNLQMLNRRLDEVVDKIQQQQTKLEKQGLRLQELQSKFAHKRVKSHRRRDEETVLRGEAEPSSDTQDLPTDCHDLFVRGQRVSGVYAIRPSNATTFNVFCEMSSDAGWTVIQRRQDGSQNFNQLWESYKSGFGNLNGDFWLGLDNIYAVSNQGEYLLRVALSDAAGRRQTTLYRFGMDGEVKNFAARLQPDGPLGEEAAAALPFTTADRDNDQAADVNCAQLLSGGWWFSNCGQSNPNGKYPRVGGSVRRHRRRRQEMFWKGSPLKTSILMITPVNH